MKKKIAIFVVLPYFEGNMQETASIAKEEALEEIDYIHFILRPYYHKFTLKLEFTTLFFLFCYYFTVCSYTIRDPPNTHCIRHTLLITTVQDNSMSTRERC